MDSQMPILSSTPARAPFLLVALLAALLAGPAQAATGFTVNGTSTSAQTLSGGTGAVTGGSTLKVSGSTVAVTVTGNNATLDNQGTITQTGTGRAIRDNTGVTGFVINNGSASNSAATIQTADGDVVQMNKAASSVTLNNYGTLLSSNASGSGNQAVDFNAVTGANVVNNYATGLLKALEADAVRPGLNGVVNNWGTILSVTATGGSSDGVDAQNNTGVVVDNHAGGKIEGGRHGITGGAADASSSFTLTIANAGTIQGDNGSGVNIDGYNAKEVVTITNSGTIIGKGVTGDGDGVDVDGLVNLINTGTIVSLNAVPGSGETVAYSEGISVGGGSITNSGLIEGLVATGNTGAKGIGITLSGNDITSGPNAGQREGLYANAVVDNLSGGTILGQTSSAIVAKGLASGYSVTINNAAGASIQGGGTTDAAIQLGADASTINNSGKIDGSSSGIAIAGGSGNLTVNISGGAATVLGNIVGGVGATNTLTIAAGAGNTFAYASGISNFDKVEIASGTVTFSGSSTYSGTTVIDGGATLVLSGANRLASSSSLDLEGGTLRLVDVATANGQSFAVFSLGADSAIDLGDSSLTLAALGQVAAGKTLTVTDDLSSSSDYALRFLGDLTGNAAFLALISGTTIDGSAVRYWFDGAYTDVAAVPEPANLALLLAGLCVIAAARRRRVAEAA
jgi:hypothetical protein